ncbi:DUF6476 family protein [Roseovarius pelagicus]|uniref:DUF6476 family protein n=1 Tax=Roseovarius pelagicus TaxID=2980108 RepID=A0ABY6DDD5_9RHOB|nr:DUF6476 family protein [Roseovarius pelagicus]UXX84176.1 DUF6476 family protein [Roseovarius pelagicus]
MEDTPQHQPIDPGMVKYLRLLVTILTATMVIGFIVIVVLFVTKFSDAFGPDLPDVITLPDGSEPLAFTQGASWYAVVTKDDQVLIYDRETGVLRQTLQID